jgi:8-oxo-dGTP pyrophosphatase MutT (NUDIX family)
VPAGTIRPGEAPKRAVAREAIEETGWTEFGEPEFLGRAEFDCSPFGKHELHDRWFFQLAIHGDPPETWRHRERDPEGLATVDGIEFAFFWLPIGEASAQLIADHGRMLPVLQARMGL